MTDPALTPDDFLTPQELRLIHCAAKGETWEPEDFPEFGPPTATQDAARTIRATIVRCLLVGDTWPGRDKSWPVSAKGLTATGAKIDSFLDLNGARIDRTAWLHRCTFTDTILLMDADCATFSLKGSILLGGLHTSRANVRGSLRLSELISHSEVNLRSSVVQNQLDCSGGQFENTEGCALDGNAITVGKDLFLRERFSAKGEVNLGGANIEGQLDCAGGRFKNPGGEALNADSMTVGADVFLRDGFSAEGKVNFERATIEGNVRCQASTFDNVGGDAINLTPAKIGGGLFFGELKSSEGGIRGLEGRLVLDHTTCRTFSDDRDSWPNAGGLVLDGFAYERFQNCSTDSAVRREWLELQSEEHLKKTFRPQPWTQAIKVLRDMGHEEDARDLAIARELTRLTSDGTKGLQKLWLRLQRRTTGFGYRPRYALYWSFLFFALGWLTFATAANLGYMAPRDGNVVTYLAAHPGAKLPEHFTRFNAPIYALDNYLPIIELGQDQAWEPSDVQSGYRRATDDPWYKEMVRLLLGHDWSVTSTAAAEGPDPVFSVKKPLVHPPGGFLAWMAGGEATLFHYGVHRFVYWALEFLGWIFVSLYIAGMSGVMKDD
jgi:hypothetical protein